MIFLIFFSFQEIRMQAEHWDTSQSTTHFVKFGGKEALYLERGIVWVNGVEMKEGSIHVSVFTPNQFAFPGIVFRADENARELVYGRNHKSGQPDALQYSPVFNGLTGWQFYYGDGYTSDAKFNHGQWTELSICFKKKSLVVFVDGKPCLTSHKLHLAPNPGRIGLWTTRGSIFANFRYDTHPPDIETKAANYQLKPGAITEWQVSSQFETVKKDQIALPSQLQSEDWQKAKTTADGLLNISKMMALEKRGNHVFAKTILKVDDAGLYALDFGFSDDAVVYLNGTPLFSASNGYRKRSHQYLGLVSTENQRLILDLKPGKHEIIFKVSEIFGGWGLTACFNPI